MTAAANQTAPLGIRPMAVIYLRVSTKDQANRGGEAEGFSIPAQRDACLRKAEAIGAVVVAEFVDAGESARSANRPELQKMLAFVKEHKVKHVIVHKIDRLARNRADDVEINLELSAAGAQLVSCSENIDETPSGMLLHGIMSSIAEFYSHNLAAESKKGMRQKAMNGGTPGMAPFGYINAHVLTDDGRQVRTVVIDEDRAQWVRWAYEKYATGDWTTSMIRDEFNRLGVTTRRRPSKPERPIANSHVNAILRNRYYVGVVRYEGVEYAGSHEPLITEALFDQVQRVRETRHTSREKPRVWSQYLKGSVYCGQCGEPLSFAKSRNRTGKVYDFFYCLGRQNMKNGCTFRAIQVHQLEDLVAEHWRTVTLREDHISQIRQIVLDHIATVLPNRAVVRQSAEATLASVDAASKKLLDAFYADAIDTHELKTEQLRLAAQRAKAQAEIERHEVSEHHLRERVENCLALLDNAHAHYLAADEISRKELNQAVFAHLYVDDDEIVASDLKPAFQRLLSGTLEADLKTERKREQNAQISTKNLWIVPDVTESTDRGESQDHHDLPTRARRTAPAARLGAFLALERPRGRLPWEKHNRGPRKDRGWDLTILVAGAGFEPATSGL